MQFTTTTSRHPHFLQLSLRFVDFSRCAVDRLLFLGNGNPFKAPSSKRGAFTPSYNRQINHHVIEAISVVRCTIDQFWSPLNVAFAKNKAANLKTNDRIFIKNKLYERIAFKYNEFYPNLCI